MQHVEIQYRTVVGQAMGAGNIAYLGPVYLFKGKLHAAATRAKFHDSADLRWLELSFKSELGRRIGEFNLQDVGLALKRYPELEYTFTRLGLDVAAAREMTAVVNLNSLPPPGQGEVQSGLLT